MSTKNTKAHRGTKKSTKATKVVKINRSEIQRKAAAKAWKTIRANKKAKAAKLAAKKPVVKADPVVGLRQRLQKAA